MLALVMVAALQDPVGIPRDLILRDPREVHLSGIRQLTFGGQNAEAYWNTEGTKLIYQSTQKDYVDEQIIVMDADGRNKKMVSSGKGRHTCGYFVPKSNDVLFSTTDWSDPGPAPKPDMSKGYVWMINPLYRLFRVNLEKATRKQLLSYAGYQAETTISTTGSFMTFTSTQDGDLEIYRSRLDGSRVVRLTSEPGYDGGPFISWDAKKIVYRRAPLRDDAHAAEYKALLLRHLVKPEHLEIWIMDADGKNKRQVTNLGAASFAPFLHPDGQRILFSSNYGDTRGREFDLWMIHTDGTGLRRITYTPEFDGFPMVTRDGKRLVWASNRNGKERGETNIFVCEWSN